MQSQFLLLQLLNQVRVCPPRPKGDLVGGLIELDLLEPFEREEHAIRIRDIIE